MWKNKNVIILKTETLKISDMKVLLLIFVGFMQVVFGKLTSRRRDPKKEVATDYNHWGRFKPKINTELEIVNLPEPAEVSVLRSTRIRGRRIPPKKIGSPVRRFRDQRFVR